MFGILKVVNINYGNLYRFFAFGIYHVQAVVDHDRVGIGVSSALIKPLVAYRVRLVAQYIALIEIYAVLG